MATRKITYVEWLKLVTRHLTGDALAHVSGYPAVEVAVKLKVHRSRVYQLIEDGTLDTVAITTADGRVAMTLVTEASLDRYLDQRVPDRGRQGYFSFQPN